MAIYPGAFDTHSDSQLAENITKTVFPQIVELLTKPITVSKERAVVPKSTDVVFTGTIDEVNRHFVDKKWGDGMAIIPPTVKSREIFALYGPVSR